MAMTSVSRKTALNVSRFIAHMSVSRTKNKPQAIEPRNPPPKGPKACAVSFLHIYLVWSPTPTAVTATEEAEDESANSPKDRRKAASLVRKEAKPLEVHRGIVGRGRVEKWEHGGVGGVLPPERAVGRPWLAGSTAEAYSFHHRRGCSCMRERVDRQGGFV